MTISAQTKLLSDCPCELVKIAYDSNEHTLLARITDGGISKLILKKLSIATLTSTVTIVVDPEMTYTTMAYYFADEIHNVMFNNDDSTFRLIKMSSAGVFE